jgi:hypothetical protein
MTQGTFGHCLHSLSAIAAGAFLLTLLAGCVTAPVTAITLSGIVRNDQTLVGETVPPEAMQLTRNGTAYRVYPDMVLEPGDALHTAADTAAVVSYPGGARAYLYPNTQVRIGSIIDDIGKVFVKVQGAFTVKTRFVTAGSEGTQYWVDVKPNDEVKVVVVEHVVRCESTTGAWPANPIHAGQQMVFHGGAAGTLAMADPAAIRRESDWVRTMDERVPVKTTVSKWVGVAAVLIPIVIIATDRDKPPDTRRNRQ